MQERSKPPPLAITRRPPQSSSLSSSSINLPIHSNSSFFLTSQHLKLFPSFNNNNSKDNSFICNNEKNVKISDGIDEFRKRSNAGSSVSKDSAKRWAKRESSANLELRCSIDPELLRNNLEKGNYLEDEQVRLNGSIFHKRTDYDYLLSVIPPGKFNGIHIKMEDDCPQGGDDVRLCLLKSLGARNLREVPCVMCHNQLPVYDRYPLIDGTFYLSPVCQFGYQIEVLFGNKRLYLQQICVECLWSNWTCNICQRADWFNGQSYIIGTLYTFDIISSARRCCSSRCSYCQTALSVSLHVIQQLLQGCYSLLNEKLVCTNCGSCHYHCIRNLDEISIAAASSKQEI